MQLLLPASALLGLALAEQCSVGDNVLCPSGAIHCMGNECCQDGTTCPSADPTYDMCPSPKTVDCTVPSSPTPAPVPTPAPAPVPPAPPAPATSACLCVFDIDRTLTGKQDEASRCPGDEGFSNIYDSAYGGGDLVLSDALLKLDQTFCTECFIGVISTGDASGPGSKERDTVVKHLNSFGKLATDVWSVPGCTGLTSPIVTSCGDLVKWTAMPEVVSWYESNLHVSIAPSDVYFYDDKAGNVEAFSNGIYHNAKQIACSKRDHMWGANIGYCGAKETEITKVSGISVCGSETVVV